jgi:16S rRNA (uracil1498-N3)-methyltransferase
MHHNRFFGEFDFKSSQITIFDRELVRQVTVVLRLGENDSIVLCDGNLNEAQTKVVSISKDRIIVDIVSVQKNQNEPNRKVNLYCAILKKENFELVIQKTVETGVHKICPVITERTIKLNLNMERISRISKEAAEQSCRGIVPAVSNPVEFKHVLKWVNQQHNVMFDITGPLITNPQITGQPGINEETNVFIGPEGGWADTELTLAKENGFIICSLGKLNLRAETAAIIATYQVISGLTTDESVTSRFAQINTDI